ncbi:MAG: hypothetical protein RO009_04410 [Pseudorhodoplanes sp.]|nr:hypothetical protein [Pseudorhodoplanes sp.]
MSLVSKFLVPAIIAALLWGMPVAGFAAEPHAHAGAAVQLKLDNGNKWQTDDALRRGMGEIRTAMAGSLAPIHKKKFTPKQYEALADRVQTQIDYVVGNCKLPEDADAQLHIVLEQIIDGVAEMKAASGGDKGAVKIVQALDLYGKYFNHAGWKPLTH